MATRVRLPPPLASVEELGSDAPLVSVIVPARNEERSIRQCVESICASDYPAFEVIVVDDRSADETVQVARRIEWKGRQYGA
jgi:chlorobactene glucosyltransferase